MGENETNEEEGRFQVGPQEGQRFRVRIDAACSPKLDMAETEKTEVSRKSLDLSQ